MRKLIVLITLLALPINVYALEKPTHEVLNEKVAVISGVDNYLKQQLGFWEGIGTVVNDKKIIQWFKDGGKKEDEPFYFRSRNHFHNPLLPWDQAGLTDYGSLTSLGFIPMSAALWAQDQSGASWINFGGDWSWKKAREYFYLALTVSDKTTREDNFAKTFRAVGQVMHLVEDVSVPSHTRNDSHLFYNYETWVDNIRGIDPVWFQNLLLTPNFFAGTINNIASLIDTNQYNGGNPQVTLSNIIGLSEFANANYFSDETIPNNDPTPLHIFSFPQVNNVNAQICEDYAPGSTDIRRYISRRTKGGCPPITQERTADHFATVSLLAAEDMIRDENINTLRLWLDDNVHNTYAKELLPRAVGYSAGILNYFFRGTLEITAPDTYVYSIIDGSSNPQQFTKIKAKVMNTTPNEQIQAGVLQAVAKYKKRTDYQPDLSTDPPTETSREPEFSYSVSASVTITSLSSTDPAEFTFDFTGSPLPAGITDLYLFVVFKGTLGNEVDNAIAAGMKDIIEPTHHVIWNLTDMVILYYREANDPEPRYHLYTEEQIRSRPELENIVRQNNIWAAYLRPHDMTIRVSYFGTYPPQGYVNPIAEAVLPGGRHIRLIILLDRDSNNYKRVTSFDSVYDNEQGSFLPSGCARTAELVGVGEDRNNGQYRGLYCDSVFSCAGYQERDGVFRYQETSVFRTFKQHIYDIGKIWISPTPSPDDRYYPDEESISADKTPYQATINFP